VRALQLRFQHIDHVMCDNLLMDRWFVRIVTVFPSFVRDVFEDSSRMKKARHDGRRTDSRRHHWFGTWIVSDLPWPSFSLPSIYLFCCNQCTTATSHNLYSFLSLFGVRVLPEPFIILSCCFVLLRNKKLARKNNSEAIESKAEADTKPVHKLSTWHACASHLDFREI
jgi:hypothetical protein